MQVVMTGGTGFIGRSLVDKLLKDGDNLAILTRDERKVDSSLNEKVGVLEADICDPVSLERLRPRVQDLDAIFHLAASLDYFGHKKKLSRVNVEGTINLLKWAEANGIKKFIYISSIEAIGTVGKGDIPADEIFVCKPVSSYGESKLEAEKQVKKFAKERNLSTAILRLGNVYGPGGLAFIAPIANAISKRGNLLKFLPVFRDRYLHPVYIKDVADGIVKAAQKSNAKGTYILAGEEYITIGALFVLIAKMLSINLQSRDARLREKAYLSLRTKVHQLRKRADLLTYFMAGEGERIHRAYSIEKAKRELDYLPKISLKEGISKTLEWQKISSLREVED